jgi:hypothetical protein
VFRLSKIHSGGLTLGVLLLRLGRLATGRDSGRGEWTGTTWVA